MIHPNATVGEVALAVPDLERSLGFYRDILGLEPGNGPGNTIRLSRAGGEPLLELVEAPGAPRPLRRVPGLYHFALLVPTRLTLARALRRLLEARWPIQGAADHGVSEALYLADPDGNGIEIYRDRPRAEWPMQGGALRMTTDPLDAQDLLGELGAGDHAWDGLDPGTRMGHVHLKVSNLPTAEAFYGEVLGFERMQRYGPSAAFYSAGGYHHHIGLNTWESAGGAPAPEDALGLRSFTIRLPDRAALEGILASLQAAGAPLEETASGWLTRDPSGNGVLLRAGDSE